ncbi:unnamed protein product, partial [Brassica oleracea]
RRVEEDTRLSFQIWAVGSKIHYVWFVVEWSRVLVGGFVMSVLSLRRRRVLGLQVLARGSLWCRGSSLSSGAVSCDITGLPFIWLFASRNLLQTPFSELSRQALGAIGQQSITPLRFSLRAYSIGVGGFGWSVNFASPWWYCTEGKHFSGAISVFDSCGCAASLISFVQVL